MPLGTTLEADLLALPDAPDKAEAAENWAGAVESYAEDVVPALAAGVMDAASAALEAALATAFATASASATAVAMEAAFAAFSTAMAAGMAPGFIGVPPPSAVGFLPLLSTDKASRAKWAEDWAAAIDTWMRLGTATPSGGGAVVNWS